MPSRKINGWGGALPFLLTAARSDARSPGKVPWKIQRFCSGILANVSAGTPKFLASTSGGVWANQSVTSSVLNSLASPSSKQITNSQPSGPRPCSECGWPAGKIPEVALVDVRDVGPAHGVENGHAATAVRHDRPLGGLMPVQFPDAAGGQPHVDAGDRV